MEIKDGGDIPGRKILADELPLSILIAEDNVINQKLLISILRMLGYEADAVSDGYEVLHAVEQKQYDLILMDIQMPQLGGEETTIKLRERFNSDGPKIIAVTAYAMG